MIEYSKNNETEDDEEGAREEIKEEVHELQDSEEDDLDPEEE